MKKDYFETRLLLDSDFFCPFQIITRILPQLHATATLFCDKGHFSPQNLSQMKFYISSDCFLFVVRNLKLYSYYVCKKGL